MNLLDRDLQRHLLELMHDEYEHPAFIRHDQLGIDVSERALQFNLAYLYEHGLIKKLEKAYTEQTFTGNSFFSRTVSVFETTISAKGIDFLQNDGGLSAILGVVTVRLHSETIQEIETKILASDQPEPEKARLLDRLRTMPEEGLKALTQELVRTGLNHAPGMWETVLRHLSG